MSDKNKKYYWLKLQKDFFKRHDIRIVEGMPNGKDYILFYLKLLVESISHYGHLRFSDTIPYTDDMLATITNTNIDIVRSAVKLFTELHMIQILDDQTIFMAEVEKMTGSETVWADKKRQYRLNKNKKEDIVPSLSDKSIDIDKDIDKEKDNIYSVVVNYLNDKSGAKYKATTKKTQTLIKARQNEGFKEQDFYIVIDKKVKEWLGTDMEKYLRPETLFGTKFESYLNQKDKGRASPDNSHSHKNIRGGSDGENKNKYKEYELDIIDI